MRDLKRSNAKLPAYKQLANEGIEVFTPMKQLLVKKQGRKVRAEVPFLQDLLFVRSSRSALDPIISKTPTLQYRYMKGGRYCEPLTVPDAEMERFVHAAGTTESPLYYLPTEITPAMYGRKIHIIGGPLDRYEGRLLKVKGHRTKYLLVELQGFLAVGVTVDSEYIRFI